MNKEEYLLTLREQLNGYSRDFRNEILDEFEAHFDEGIAEGKSEKEIMEELGTVEDVMNNIRMLNHEPIDSAGPESDIRKGIEFITRGVNETISTVRDSLRNVMQDEEPLSGTPECGSTLYIEGNLDLSITPGDTFSYTFHRTSSLFSRSEAQLTIRSSESGTSLLVTGGSAVLQVKVPSSVTVLEVRCTGGDFDMADLLLSSLKVNTASADIEMHSVRATTMSLHTKSGDISLNSCMADELEAIAVSGDIEMHDVVSDLYAQTTSGDIDIITQNGSRAKVYSVSGDIDVRTNSINTEIHTSSGDIALECLHTGPFVSVQSISGDVDIRLADDDFTAQLSTVSGEIENRTRQKSYSHAGHQSFGSGVGYVDVRSTSGDITLRTK